MSKKKKIILLSSMVALLSVTAIFNFVYTAPISVDNTSYVDTSNYFTQYREERITSRNEEILQLDSVINASEAGSIEQNEALTLKTKLSLNSEKELLLESLIKAYGFTDAVVVMGIDSDNVNVITKSTNLTSDDAITIYTIINEEVAVGPENVKIIPIS